jgi:protoheme IX farnesyltransferase
VPMLPVVAGPLRTARAMLLYALATVAVSLVPVLVGDLKAFYLAVALGVGGWLVAACWQHLRRLELASARSVFLTSLSYLGLLFVAAATDTMVL